ncbi:flagellar assembly protein FliX [Methylobacterium oryzihabitans]|uniref:Flagellar assembly protein fliX n=1 Tax=Methylobacterium oryzihabitans TaxID=2499852 RepID=A0A3S2W7B4_9HYPH|nr:flagellar assembly protein FliX [Methylobacterium oryzihabitans]RVU15501.1 flagellar assembly protein fliX [Methylobacterium oryzihabitans]
MRVDPRFAPAPATAAAPGRAGAGSAAPLAGLDAILTLQAQDDPAERRRRAARRGHDLLDALDRLKAALLGGRVNAADLTAIAARLAERAGATGDPRLDGLIGEIELRAQVELAKLASAGRATAG